MDRLQFLDMAADKIIYLDGATGSNLVKAGMPPGVCPEKWILEHPLVMQKLQEEYVLAGSDILYAPTFTANRIKLAEYGLADGMEQMIRELVAISKKAAEIDKERRIYIAGDVSMTGESLRPVGNMEFETLVDIYKEQIGMLDRAGVDLIVVETMMSLAETRAALIAAKEISRLPVMVSFTFEADGRMLYGTDARTAAIVAESLGACAVGANCSCGPRQMAKVIEEIASVTTIPVIAKPNAGMPSLDASGKTVYDMDAACFCEEAELLLQAGASVIGGCCGTAPEYLRALTEKYGVKPLGRTKRRPEGVRYLCSERMTVSFGLDSPFLVVGERINPTGKKLLQAKLREGDTDLVLQFAEEQENCGASILDINMGMSGIDEKEMMLRVLEEVSTVTNLPLSIDSSHVEVIEAALRIYPGRALINSISLESEKFEKLIPIAAKYGAMFILLPLSDAGLPKDLEEKKTIIKTVSERAYSLGMRREDIVVDGLVTTVGANKAAGLETLETIRYCRENGFATICGLSNISFGMPERSYVNTAFLTLAIQAGLSMAIANPSQDMLMCCAYATDLLMDKEEADLRYIRQAAFVKEKQERERAAAKIAEKENTASAGDAREIKNDNSVTKKEIPALSPHAEAVYHAVLKGNRKGIAKLVQSALDEKEPPEGLLNGALLPAINQVGDYFDKGKYFLPQLIASAEAMKSAIEVLEPLLMKESDGGEKPAVVIATVEGDIHDIGKNLVALMLKNYGFEVIDLGKDIPSEQIIQAAKEHNAKIIALSALMTTTMQRMREVIADARREKPDAKIMIGGAVITQEYADEIGADGYSKDAADAVRLAQKLNG